VSQNPFSIAGRTALITGASRGIGLAIAELLVEQGAEVILVSRKQESLDEAAAALRARGGRAHAIAAHMGRTEDIGKLVAALDERGLAVDILVNNAGISPPHVESLADTTEALWDKVMDVNLKGPFFLSGALGKKMVARGRGSIINISTTSALMAQPERAGQCHLLWGHQDCDGRSHAQRPAALRGHDEDQSPEARGPAGGGGAGRTLLCKRRVELFHGHYLSGRRWRPELRVAGMGKDTPIERSGHQGLAFAGRRHRSGTQPPGRCGAQCLRRPMS